MFDVAIVGGGLSGLVAALRLKQLGKTCVVIDSSLPDANGKPGGFAKFSGAKFSLPPAGMGLLSVVRDEEQLWKTMRSVIGILDLNFREAEVSNDATSTSLAVLRRYQSLVLTPDEIDDKLDKLKTRLEIEEIELICGRCERLNVHFGSVALEVAALRNSQIIEAERVFYAGGRLGEETLVQAGLVPIDKKGLDVGARIEFESSIGLNGLRQLGPDAKIIWKNCRTFCLNVPGKIYRYPYENISIPGGIVAGPEENKANFGILLRTSNKRSALQKIIGAAGDMDKSLLESGFPAHGTTFGEATELLENLYGKKVADRLNEFGTYLADQGLVDWREPHLVHLPLIDWHWNTYSKEDSFQTTIPEIYCIGDMSGHARGLLQAAASGWIAAEEYADAI